MQIPQDLDGCMLALDNYLSEEDREAIIAMSEDDLFDLHHTLGRWIRNNWGLWNDSRLFQYLKSLGFIHPDDMSQSIIVEYWNRKNKQPSQLEADIAEYKAYWEKFNEPK